MPKKRAKVMKSLVGQLPWADLAARDRLEPREVDLKRVGAVPEEVLHRRLGGGLVLGGLRALRLELAAELFALLSQGLHLEELPVGARVVGAHLLLELSHAEAQVLELRLLSCALSSSALLLDHEALDLGAQPVALLHSALAQSLLLSHLRPHPPLPKTLHLFLHLGSCG